MILHIETCYSCGGRGGYYASESPYNDPREMISFPSFWHMCFDCDGTGIDHDHEDRVISWIKMFTKLTDKNDIVITQNKADEAFAFLKDEFKLSWGKDYMAVNKDSQIGIIFRFDDEIVATAFKLKFYEGEILC